VIGIQGGKNSVYTDIVADWRIILKLISQAMQVSKHSPLPEDKFQ
jgi:hypothetical protein